MSSIFLAVGHGVSTDGSWDCGCTDGNYNEADLAWNIVGSAVATLRANGVTVHTDYDTGNDRNITYCVRDANALGVDCYVSVHVDWNQAPSGIYPLVASSSGEQLANCIRNAMKARMNINDRGTAYSDDYEVSGTDMTACIFEMGGIRSDIDSLVNEADLRGQCLAFGIMDFLGVSYSGTPVKQTTQASTGNTVNEATGSTIEYNVENIQYFLHICNYQPDLDIDGDYGTITTSGVENAQAAYGIDADGDFGPITEVNAKGQVLAYQQRLQDLGFYNGTLDGIAGQQTLQSVQEFQSAHGLDADGCIGPATFPILMNAENYRGSLSGWLFFISGYLKKCMIQYNKFERGK